MNYFSTDDSIIVENLSDFNIVNTFECGQCFRFNKIDNFSYMGIVFGKVIFVSQKNNQYIIKGITLSDFENIFISYFDLNLDYNKIRSEISKISPNLKLACKYSQGIRILNQDPWEALCSFIISQNNNIPRIKSIIEALCLKFGEKIYDNFYTFPKAKVLATLKENDLSDIKCGFRDKYILDAANKVYSLEVDLDKISKLPIESAREELMKIKGVGPKVAECELLYGMHRLEAFPIDTWMKKALNTLFKDISIKDLGPYAGIAQQYIFHYSRMNSNLLFESHNSAKN